MSFTLQELENISNATIDFHMDKGKIFSQTIQNKPLLQAFEGMKKTFPGGKDYLTVRVKGEYDDQIEGFEADDEVDYSNPADIKMATYQYKRIHKGIKVTYDELQRNGISITDTVTGRSSSVHSDAEEIQLANLLDDKIESMMEGRSRGMNNMFWRDGSTDSSLCPGITSFILNDPTSATVVGGIDQSSNTWWRNYAQLGISTASPTSSTIAQAMQKAMRQMNKRGNPKFKLFAGSDFLDALETEMRVNGYYTQNGWANKGSIDVSVSDAAFKGVTVTYDPTLDDESKQKYLYALDINSIYPMYMDGEKNKSHSPARPANKYVLYRAVTDVLGVVCRQRNTSGVLTIA